MLILHENQQHAGNFFHYILNEYNMSTSCVYLKKIFMYYQRRQYFLISQQQFLNSFCEMDSNRGNNSGSSPCVKNVVPYTFHAGRLCGDYPMHAQLRQCMNDTFKILFHRIYFKICVSHQFQKCHGILLCNYYAYIYKDDFFIRYGYKRRLRVKIEGGTLKTKVGKKQRFG